jgi:hypothetical protein
MVSMVNYYLEFPDFVQELEVTCPEDILKRMSFLVDELQNYSAYDRTPYITIRNINIKIRMCVYYYALKCELNYFKLITYGYPLPEINNLIHSSLMTLDRPDLRYPPL